ncbi:MAG: DNA recombination protein RmuC [Betaproteobacteria bacterium]
MAQAGNAAQVELAQARERVRAGEQELAGVRAELERARAEGQAWRNELDASRDEAARLAERASRVATLEAEVAQLADHLRGAGAEVLRVSASEAQKSQQARSQGDRIAALEGELQAALAQARARADALQAANEELAQLRTRADAERESALEKLQLLTEAKTALSDQFKTLATEILEEKSKRFAEQNQQNLGTLLDPLRTQLNEFKGKVEEVYVQEGKDRSALSEQVRQLMELNQTLSRDATNLTNALKGSAKTQGNWGELILERVLEASGLRKGHEYHVQDSQLDEEGRRLQPDVVIHLPEDRRLVVDAKVSLVAYDRFTSATTDDERATSARAHMESVRNHIRGLSAKRYQDLYGLKSLDLVVMFVPIEPAFMLAVTHDDALFMDAWQRNVLLVSPSTLLFVVRTIAHLWRQEAQSRNAQDIAKRGTELYDKLSAFVADLQKVGAKLKDAQSAYEDAEKKLSTGKGNVIRQAEMLKGLGLKTAKALPPALVDASGDGDEPPTLASEPMSLPLFEQPADEDIVP